jgi:PKD repeat protein
MKPKTIFVSFIVFLFLSVGVGMSQDLFRFNPALIATFGKDADAQDGDDDFYQDLFFVNRSDSAVFIYLRVFDPEVYGNVDYKAEAAAMAGSPPKTSFEIFEATPVGGESLLLSKVFTNESRTDSRWVTLTGIQVQPKYVYKLVIRGLSGVSGNLYDFFFSSQSDLNVPVRQLSVYTHKLNIRQFRAANMVIRLPFVLPQDSVKISNYDCDNVVKSSLSIPGVAGRIPLPISGSAEWKQKTIPVPAAAAGKLAFVNILTDPDYINDLIFTIYDAQGNPIPIQLPTTVVAADSVLQDEIRTFVFDGRESHDVDNENLSFKWDFGDGASSEEPVVTHTFPSYGTFYVSLEVRDNSGAKNDFSREDVTIKINRLPQAVIDYRQNGYADKLIQFSSSRSFDEDNEIVEYFWSFGDGTFSPEKNPLHQYESSGTYLVTLTVTDNSGSIRSKDSDIRYVTINNPPVAAAENESPLGDAHVVLNGEKSHDPDGDGLSYSWDFGDGDTGTGIRVAHTYAKPGSYIATLRVSDDSGIKENFDRYEVLVKVNSPPVASFSAEPPISSARIHFSAAASHDPDGKIRGYLWDFGDGSEGSGVEVDHIFDKPGEYRVKLTVVDNSEASNSTASAVKTVFINKKPIAKAGDDVLAGVGQEIIFDGLGSYDPDGELGEYIWDFGDGSPPAREGKTVHVYHAPGEYKARLTVIDKSGTDISDDTDIITVKINSSPVASISISPEAAGAGEKMTFNGSGSMDFDEGDFITKYDWDFGDGATAGGKTVVHQYQKSGQYTVSLRVEDNSKTTNKSNITRREIHINTPPVAEAGQDILQQSLTVRFDASASYDIDGDALEYVWTFGDGAKSETGTVVSHRYLKNGTYRARLRVLDKSGAKNNWSMDSLLVSINFPPYAIAGEDRIVGMGKEITFDASQSHDPDGDRLAFEWDFGDGDKAQGARVSHVFKKIGTFPVNLIVRDGSGIPENVSFDKLVVTVGKQPVADAGEDMEVKIFSEVRFDGSKSWDLDGVVNEYIWDFGDGATAKGEKPAHSYQKSGVYKVKLTIVGDKLEGIPNVDTDEITVMVHEAPIARAGEDVMAAENEVIEFDGSASTSSNGGIISYTWDFGDGTTGEGARVKHAYAQYGTYKVRLTVMDDRDSRWNTNYDEIQVVINRRPEAEASFAQIVNPGDMIAFDGSGSQDIDGFVKQYLWDFGDSGKGADMYTKHVYAQPGTYTVSLTVVDNTECRNNSHTITLPIHVNRPPQPVAGPDRVVGVGDEVKLDGSASHDPDGAIASWFWSFGDGDTAQTMIATHRFAKPGKYNVTLEVQDTTGLSSGKASDIAIVTVNHPPQAVANRTISAAPGDEVVLDAGRSIDPDGSITEYVWIFPDGTRKSGKVVSYVFNQSGEYDVRLRVTDNAGVSNSTAEAIQKVKVNHAPIAKASGDTIVSLYSQYAVARFDGSQSKDPDGNIILYEWDFGDGTKTTGVKAEHRYKEPGKYTVKLTVTDDSKTRNGKASDAMTVIANMAPKAVIKVGQPR